MSLLEKNIIALNEQQRQFVQKHELLFSQFDTNSNCHQQEKRMIEELVFSNDDSVTNNETYAQWMTQLAIKRNSYKQQDKEKNLLDVENFVTKEEILRLLLKSEVICDHCKCHVKIIYTNVRDQRQWTLDRIDNRKGHNAGNVVVACLKCNISRQTKLYHQFKQTKQLTVVKLPETYDNESELGFPVFTPAKENYVIIKEP
jgi:hypothetical protein